MVIQPREQIKTSSADIIESLIYLICFLSGCHAEEAAVGVGFDLINAARALFAIAATGMSVLHNVCVCAPASE